MQRINECDERKGTSNINKFYLDASKVSDHVVFVSTWLKNIYVDIGMNRNKTSVILAGANKEIFNSNNSKEWGKEYPIKIVTHHWSSHKNKGFDIYSEIDNLISNSEWSNKIEFTYIGNMNNEYELKNTKIVKPLAGLELAEEIKKHHLYVTASVNEPSEITTLKQPNAVYQYYTKRVAVYQNTVKVLEFLLIIISNKN